MKNLLKILLVATSVSIFSGSANACDQTLSESEILTLKNEAVLQVLNEIEVGMDQATVIFDDNFAIAKGIRGNCEAITINGQLTVQYDLCEATATFSTAADAQRMDVTQKCL